jgi:hypothetical protein
LPILDVQIADNGRFLVKTSPRTQACAICRKPRAAETHA